jgi:phosphohistidine phosphatase
VTSRRLIAMRHTKAEPFAESDDLRHLTERGRRDAAEAGRHLAELGLRPDLALVSSAVRARETWQAVADGLAEAGAWEPVAPVCDDRLYTGGPEDVVECVQATAVDADTVLVVGHNPTIAHVVHLLDDSAGDPEAVNAVLRGYPAGAMTVLEVEVPWQDLGAETGRVIDFHSP